MKKGMSLSIAYTINHSDLTLGKELGRGGFGVVYQATWRHNEVAVKQLLMDKISAESAKEFEAESQVMSQLRSPNIVQFYGFCMSPTYCIVMEYMPNGSLFSVLRNNNPLEWATRISIALDTAKGLAFLHQENILHRDIKSLNVLLSKNYAAKLTDFGLSKVKEETKSHSMATKTKSDSVGTIAWMAPELFKRKAVFTPKSDIYSLGITFWELTSRKIPFADAASQDLIPGWVKEGEREDIPADCSSSFGTLIQTCWEGEPDKRPTADDVVTRLKSAIEAISSHASLSTSDPKYADNFHSAQLVSDPQYRDNFGSEAGPARPLTLSLAAPKSVPVQQAPLPQPMTASVIPTPQFAQIAIANKPAPRINPSDLSKFLKLVAEGEQDQAEALLKITQDLAYASGDVTDFSNRTFKGITGFQYAVWALDWHMWTMMRKYLPDDKAREQCEAMESGSWVSQYGIHANWDKLTNALGACVRWWNQSKWSEGNQHWVQQVGSAQLLLPAHVINEYCHLTRSLSPCPDFIKSEPNGAWRTRQTDEGEWFTCQYQGGGLGNKFAVARGSNSRALAVMELGSHDIDKQYMKIHDAKVDQAGVRALYDTRSQQRDELLTELKRGNRQQLKDDRNKLGEWPNSYPRPNTGLSTLSPISGDSFSSEASSSRPVTFSSAVPKPIAQSIDTPFGQTPFARPGVAPAAAPIPPLAPLAIANPTTRINPSDLSKFLKLVAEGEQDQAEALLKITPDLAYASGDVTDLSNRTFKGITALQYAVWALDWHMWTMLLKYLSLEHVREQANGFDTGSWVSLHGVHANGNQLIKAYEKYNQLYQSKRGWKEVATQWVNEVGGAQLLLPAHVVNEYCHPTRSFSPLPDFTKEPSLPRSRQVGYGKAEWFTLIMSKKRTDNPVAYLRGDSNRVDSKSMDDNQTESFQDNYHRYHNKYSYIVSDYYYKHDIAAIRALFTSRTQQRNQLVTELAQGQRQKFSTN